MGNFFIKIWVGLQTKVYKIELKVQNYVKKVVEIKLIGDLLLRNYEWQLCHEFLNWFDFKMALPVYQNESFLS